MRAQDISANYALTASLLVIRPVMLSGMDFMKPAEQLLAQVAARFGSAEAFLDKLAEVRAQAMDDTVEMPRVAGGLPTIY